MKIKINFTIVLLMVSLLLNSQEHPMETIKPSYLKQGDTVAIVAPSGVLNDKLEEINRAKKLLELWGLKVVFGKNLFKNDYHFAGTDKERSNDFQEALDKQSIKAIWSARGGYGSVRILDKLDFSEFKKNPKWIIGYSDITAFHNHINNMGVETIHAMMPSGLGVEQEDITETITTFKKAIFGEKLSYEIPLSSYNRPIISSNFSETIEGQIIGGNLTILSSMLGSKSQIKTRGKILFIEEIGEYKYSIDRMLQSLKRAGYFDKLKGVLVGDISNIKKNTTKWGVSIEQLILDVIPKELPIFFNFPAGHEKDNRALIFGRNIKIKNTKKNTVTINFDQK